jgi:hypothetical protein
MQAETLTRTTRERTTKGSHLPPLEAVGKPNLTTEETAYYTNRTPKTLRSWACYENGPIRPLRINGRLAWPVSEVKRILGIASN